MYLSLVTSLVCNVRVLFIILSLSGRVFFYAANWRRACLQHLVKWALVSAESFLRSVQSLAKHHIFILLWTILCE